METKNNQIFPTSDKVIRIALRQILEEKLREYRKRETKAEIFEELGVQHGSARVDYAFINGEMCGYEIKSDKDTLERLPEQMQEFNAVFDRLTLIVGKRHLYQAIHEIQEWWGVVLAKDNTAGKIILQTIREPSQNPMQKGISIARLLWKEEALKILEKYNDVSEVRHKPREFIYQKLAEVFNSDLESLKEHVSSFLITREGWRSLSRPVTYDD